MPQITPGSAGARALLGVPDCELFARANALRQRDFGQKITFCAIINIRSGHCGMDCAFCAQSRASGANIASYPLLSDALLREKVESLAKLPVSNIGLVASGLRLDGSEFDRFCRFVADCPEPIKKRLCASLGNLSGSQLEQLKAAGITHIHHNLETSEKFYPCICSSQTWGERLDAVGRYLEAGVAVCSGGLFGMGESWQDRADLALTLANAGITNVPLNFLHPQPGTPLAGRKPLAARDALRIIALFRNILPHATLRVCGGRPVTLGERQREIFAAGANALMTGDYLTTQGMATDRDAAMLAALGLELV